MSLQAQFGRETDYDRFVEKLDYLQDEEEQVEANTFNMELSALGDTLTLISADQVFDFQSDLALGQFLNRACGPYSKNTWLFSCQQDAVVREHIIDALNQALVNNNTEVVLHVYGGTIAGATSQRYTKVYDREMIEIPIFTEDNFLGGYIGDTVTNATFEVEQYEAEKVGDLFGLGVKLSNNQWGRHGLSVAGYAMRLACTNGMVTKEDVVAFNCRHVGDNVMSDYLNSITRVIDGIDSLRQNIDASIDSTVSDVETTLDSVLRRVSKKSLQESVLNELAEFRRETNEQGDVSKYALANALSAVGVKNPDHMDDMEVAAGIVYAMA